MLPQLADAEQVLAGISLAESVEAAVLVPNLRGLDRALALRDRFQHVSGFVSASETHNRMNVGRPVEESVSELELVMSRAREEGLSAGAVISVSFGCPYEGRVEPEAVFAIARRLVAAGAGEIGFGDTTGMANPLQVRSFFPAAREALGGEVELTAHFHNTRGQGLANVLAALESGCESFESSFGEIGGCPVPAGRHRQHRNRGPRLDAPRDGHRDRGRSRRAPRRLTRARRGSRPPARLPHARSGPRVVGTRRSRLTPLSASRVFRA